MSVFGRSAAVGAAAVLAVSVISCGSISRSQSRVEEPAGNSYRDHGMEMTRLRMLMASLEQLTFDQLREGIDEGLTREEHLKEIHRAAAGLAKAASELPTGIEEYPLTDEQVTLFRSFADALFTDAIALRDRAATGKLGTAEQEIDPLVARCNACHRAFYIDPMHRG